MRNTDLKCLKRVIVVELHSGLSLDMTYTLSFAVADLLWIFICGIDLRLKSHRDIHDHLNPAPTYHTDHVDEERVVDILPTISKALYHRKTRLAGLKMICTAISQQELLPLAAGVGLC